jgi:hypothetical protein
VFLWGEVCCCCCCAGVRGTGTGGRGGEETAGFVEEETEVKMVELFSDRRLAFANAAASSLMVPTVVCFLVFCLIGHSRSSHLSNFLSLAPPTTTIKQRNKRTAVGFLFAN